MAGYLGNALVARLGTDQPRTVAEIGVFEGYTSAWLLARMPQLRLYMVDQWREYKDSPQPDSKLSGVKWANVCKKAHAVTQFADARRIILQGDSVEMAAQIPDGSLDLAFIDANHTKQGVMRDIAAYWPKVKPGGWLAGHDWEPKEPRSYGVNDAVTEFGAQMFMTPELDEDATWFFRKTMECGRTGADTIRHYQKLIETSTHFAQANYGDGEWGCILDHAGVNVQGEVYNPTLRDALRHTLLQPVGQWCGTNPGRKLRDEAEAYVARYKVSVPWRKKEILPDANIEGNLGGFLGAVRKRNTILVGPSHLAALPERVIGPHRFIAVPDGIAWAVVDRTIAAVRAQLKDGDLVLFASGMATNLAVHRLWPDYKGRVTLLDIGALLDPYVGVYSRAAYRKPEFQDALRKNLS